MKIGHRYPQSSAEAHPISLGRTVGCGMGSDPQGLTPSMRVQSNAKSRHRQAAARLLDELSAAFNKMVEGRARKRLGRAAGLTQFGVNICTLKPGAASSRRHWHEKEDELVYALEGQVVLCEDDGETPLKAGVPNGHCLVNRSDRDAVFIEI